MGCECDCCVTVGESVEIFFHYLHYFSEVGIRLSAKK